MTGQPFADLSRDGPSTEATTTLKKRDHRLHRLHPVMMNRLTGTQHTCGKATRAHLLLCVRRLLVGVFECMVRAEQVLRLPVVLIQSGHDIARHDSRLPALRLLRGLQLLGLTPLRLLIMKLAVCRVVRRSGRLPLRIMGLGLHRLRRRRQPISAQRLRRSTDCETGSQTRASGAL